MNLPVKLPVKVRTVALAVPAVLLVAACGATATTASRDDAGSSAGSSAGGTKALAPAPAPADSLSDSVNAELNSLNAPDSADLAVTSGTGRTKSSAGSPAQADPAQADPAQADPAQSDPVDQTQPDQTRAIISQGKISLRTKDIEDERFKLKQLLDDWNGSIANEESDADAKGRTRHERLELRVPAAKFDTAMDAISKLGTLIDRTRTSEDVTTKVIDTAVRVRTQKLSLARIQALLDQATSLNQIISIESQLSRRQAQLDSLEAQQKYLADQTAESTINVYFSVPSKHATTMKKKHHDDGFLAGLRGGWHNLGEATNTVLHAVGGALPFGALLVVIGVPVWAARRRRTRIA